MDISSLPVNLVDFVVIIIFIYFLTDTWRFGFWVVLADFLGFLISIIAALFGYSFVSNFLQDSFALTRTISNALGFLVIAGFTEVVFSLVFLSITARIPLRFRKNIWSKVLAIVPALGQGAILASFLLTLTMSLPILPKVKAYISKSRIAGYLLEKTTGLEKQLSEVFGGLAEDTLTYLTIQPDSQETIALQVEEFLFSIDDNAEEEMLGLVNTERIKAGVNQLSLKEELVPIARAYARDMWERKYFGHFSPEGEDVGDRLSKSEIEYTIAGENLALAPTVQTAHTGLMNSEGHKKNILDTEFKRIGIGVIDNGVYGKMFVQIFTD